MRLSRKTLATLQHRNTAAIPKEALFLLPEKVLQFGTGVYCAACPIIL